LSSVLPLSMGGEGAFPETIERLRWRSVEPNPEYLGETLEPFGAAGQRVTGRGAFTDASQGEAADDVDSGCVSRLCHGDTYKP